MVPEQVSTDRFRLRRFSRRDVDAIAQAVAASLPRLNEWLPWAHLDYQREDAAAFIRDSMQAWREGRAFDFAIRRPNQPEIHLGNVSIWHVSRLARIGEIGYWVRSDETGKGIATEVTERLLVLGFQELGFHKMTLRIAIGNRASERVAEKLGFTVEGVLREELMLGGQWVDHTLYSLLEQEYLHRRTTGRVL